jgi:hypothetical protein
MVSAHIKRVKDALETQLLEKHIHAVPPFEKGPKGLALRSQTL